MFTSLTHLFSVISMNISHFSPTIFYTSLGVLKYLHAFHCLYLDQESSSFPVNSSQVKGVTFTVSLVCTLKVALMTSSGNDLGAADQLFRCPTATTPKLSILPIHSISKQISMKISNSF